MKYVIVCYDKVTHLDREYDAIAFLDPESEVGKDCALKPISKTDAIRIVMALLGGHVYQNAKEALELRTAIPPRVFLEIQGGILTYVAQDRQGIDVYVMDWDNAKSEDADDDDKQTTPGATMEVFQNEDEVQAYIARTKYEDEPIG